MGIGHQRTWTLCPTNQSTIVHDETFRPIDNLSIETYLGGGLVWTGPSASRASDAGGLAVAHADFGRPYATAAGGDLKPETTWELSYRYAIGDGLDVQYIRHPSGDPQVDDALVVGYVSGAG